MPVRLRITLVFALIVFIILTVVCTGIYFFSHQARINAIKTRLTNRAITTARLLSRHEIFDRQLVERIDSATTIAIKDKAVQAYDALNRRVYQYSDQPNDTLPLLASQLQLARQKGSYYFNAGTKEAIAYYAPQPTGGLVVVVAGEDTEGQESLAALLRILLVSFLVGMICVVISGYFFSKGLLQPVRKISEDVTEISARNLTRRIATGTAEDEWAQLARTLNELLNRLQESFDMQRRFIANASHELSTPLTAVSSQLEVALQRNRSTADYQQVLQSVLQDVKHLNRLTQTLLEFAKASGNAGGLEIDLLRIDELVLNLPSAVSKVKQSYTVSLQFGELPEDEQSLLVFGNEALLATALKNLVINACKYSPNQTAVVRLQIRQADCFIEVEDRGPGIPEAERENIFQPFYRLTETRAAGGFGLGLPLASRIVKIHKGSISVRPAAAVGTIFTVQLPLAKKLEGLQPSSVSSM